MNDALQSDCAEIFRRIGKLHISRACFGWNNERLLNEPLEKLDVDSITLLEFIMELESVYHVKLDENDVNRCGNVKDFVALIEAARSGSH